MENHDLESGPVLGQSYFDFNPRQSRFAALFSAPLRGLLNARCALGLDVSYYDWGSQPGGVLDYKAMKEAGVSFVVLKAMDGNTETKGFRENYAAAMAADLVVLCYQFIYSSLSANTQAQRFAELMKQFPPHLPPVVDFEAYLDSKPDSGQLGGYMTTFNTAYGQYPIIYTSPGYWGSYGSAKPFFAQSWLWAAHWGAISPSVPAPWTDWTFWQFSASGDPSRYGYDMTVPYPKKAVDENWFNGTEQDLRVLAGLENGGDPPPTTGETMWKGTIESNVPNGLGIFPEPNFGPLVNQVLPSGSVVYGTDIEQNGWLWLYVENAGYVPVRNGGSGWTVKYITLKSEQPPEQPPEPPVDPDKPTFGKVEIAGKTYEATGWERVA